jgi:hypothetical protein
MLLARAAIRQRSEIPLLHRRYSGGILARLLARTGRVRRTTWVLRRARRPAPSIQPMRRGSGWRIAEEQPIKRLYIYGARTGRSMFSGIVWESVGSILHTLSTLPEIFVAQQDLVATERPRRRLMRAAERPARSPEPRRAAVTGLLILRSSTRPSRPSTRSKIWRTTTVLRLLQTGSNPSCPILPRVLLLARGGVACT